MIDNYHLVLDEIARGKDLMPRASRKQFQNNHTDNLLLDLGIHHLHLGREKIKTKYHKEIIEGTSNLLYIYLHQDTAYVLGIFDHSYLSNDHLFEIIAASWPELLDGFNLNREDITAINISSIDRGKLRKVGINTPYFYNGKAYFGIGGGFVASGFGTDDSEKSLCIIRAINKLKTLNIESILEEFYAGQRVLDFRLDLDALIFGGLAILSEKDKPQIKIKILTALTNQEVIAKEWAVKLCENKNFTKITAPKNANEALIEID